MSRRNQMILLGGLFFVLAVVLYRNMQSTPEIAPGVSRADEKFQPIAVENPALRLDLLERLKKLQYTGSHRNIFNVNAPPPPPSADRLAAKAQPAAPAPPPGPPPLVVPATFFGYVTDSDTGVRRAFFSEGDNVYIVGIGETLLNRFRLIQIGNSTAELEETASGRRTTLTMEEPGPS